MLRTAHQIAAARRSAATWPQEFTLMGELHHFTSEAPRCGGTEPSAWYLTDAGRWVRMARDKAGTLREVRAYVPSFEELDAERHHSTSGGARTARASWADDAAAPAAACRF